MPPIFGPLIESASYGFYKTRRIVSGIGGRPNKLGFIEWRAARARTGDCCAWVQQTYRGSGGLRESPWIRCDYQRGSGGWWQLFSRVRLRVWGHRQEGFLSIRSWIWGFWRSASDGPCDFLPGRCSSTVLPRTQPPRTGSLSTLPGAPSSGKSAFSLSPSAFSYRPLP